MGTRSRAAQKRKPNTRNQATSTSDPVIEDDHEQVRHSYRTGCRGGEVGLAVRQHIIGLTWFVCRNS